MLPPLRAGSHRARGGRDSDENGASSNSGNQCLPAQSELRFARFAQTLAFSQRKVNGLAPKSAQRELLRYLRLGKSIRSHNGANHVRNFILETQADPVIHRLCRAHQIKVADLCLACTEILEERRASAPSEENPSRASTLLFSDPLRLEGFLKNLRQATHGQAAIQRRLAIIACAKDHAARMGAAPPAQRPAGTRSNLLQKSIFNNLMLMMLVAGLVLIGMLLAVFLL